MLGVHAFGPRIGAPKGIQAPHIRHPHTAVLRLPQAKRRTAEFMLAQDVGYSDESVRHRVGWVRSWLP